MKGILINYEYCTGCHSCEVACRNELGLTHGEYGIKLTEVGPYEYVTDKGFDTPYEWVYNPTLTKACNMCEQRTAVGKMPSCVQACQAWCIYYGETEELVKKMDGKTRFALYTVREADQPSPFVPTGEVFTGTRGWKIEAPAEDAAASTSQMKVSENLEVNLVVRGEEKLEAFLNEFANIDKATAEKQIEEQALANEKATKYVLSAADAKDGQEHTLNCTAVVQSYDAQGTQLGGGKAYLDKGQEIARKDITIVFM